MNKDKGSNKTEGFASSASKTETEVPKPAASVLLRDFLSDNKIVLTISSLQDLYRDAKQVDDGSLIVPRPVVTAKYQDE